MEIFQIVGLGLISTVLVIILKTHKPEMAMQVGVITGIAIFMLVATKLSAVVSLLYDYMSRADIDTSYIGILLKIIGIAYIAEFGAEICKDAGESAIASKIELAGKVIIIVIAVPIFTSLLDLVIEIMP